MGDPRRFDLMAALVEAEFPAYRDFPIADVAGGKGYLRAALYERGYRNVVTIDRRHANAKKRPHLVYGHFDWRKSEDYALVLAMHPDEATDHVLLYCRERRRPFVVCPCCVKPSAVLYNGHYTFGPWLDHLRALASTMEVRTSVLEMSGRSTVLIGRPQG